ncbi:DUF4148 domain-containing protein [Alcaligenes nematophilus]
MKLGLWTVACTALIASSAAWAADGTAQVPGQSYSKSRAQVVQELQEAQQAGLLNFADDEYPVLPAGSVHKTRQQVVQELEQARKQGRLLYVAP